jgi:hypothetical protein
MVSARSAIALALACGGLTACAALWGFDDLSVGAAGRGDDAGSDAPAGLPTHAPQGLTFEDTSGGCSTVGGIVSIEKAEDESDVTGYALYFGSDPRTKLGSSPITVLTATGQRVDYRLANTAPPPGAYYLLAFSTNALGEMSTGVAASLRQATFSAGQGSHGANWVSLVLDPSIRKSLLVTGVPETNNRPALVRCDLDTVDAKSCTWTDLSQPLAQYGSVAPTALVDMTNHRLLVVAENYEGGLYKPALFLCNLDGSACSLQDLSGGQGSVGATFPTPVIDSRNNRLLIATSDSANGNRASLIRCNLDGTGCAKTDISAGSGPNSGGDPQLGDLPAAVVDTANAKILVVTTDGANGNRPTLFRCDLDGTGCTATDISAGQGENSSGLPHALIEPKSAKLLVVTADTSGGKSRVSLFRCNLDGTSCAHTDLTAPVDGGAPRFGAPVIDTVNGKLLVLARSTATASGLVRCNLDGSGCDEVDPSAGFTGENVVYLPSPVIDTKSGKLLVADVADPKGNPKPGLRSICTR